MTLVLLTLVCGLVLSFLILLGGWFLTAPARYRHQENMFELNEKSKLNAIEVQARQVDVDERRIKSLEAGYTNIQARGVAR